MTKYSLLIPTYNERENISLLIYMIDKILTTNKINYEIIIVEDNSPDKTIDSVKEMQKLYGIEKIKILERPGKLGLAIKNQIQLKNQKMLEKKKEQEEYSKKKVDDVLKNLEEYNKLEEKKRLKLEQETFEKSKYIIILLFILFI